MDKLRAALGNDLSGAIIQENVDYYNGYISEETGKGRLESEVIAELGDPWALAQTIIDSAEKRVNTGAGNDSVYETRRGYEQNQDRTEKMYTFGFDCWWKKLLLVLGIVGIVVVIGAVVGGIISLVAPLIVPVIIIAVIIKAFGNRS